jgi:hypothetical protein
MKAGALLLVHVLLICTSIDAQDVKVDYDKKHDFSIYKTFSISDGEVVTPDDQRQVPESTVKKWIHSAISRELTAKGLKEMNEGADLTLFYTAGALQTSQLQDLGPLGYTATPTGEGSRTFGRDYASGTLAIDMKDSTTGRNVWKVYATGDVSSGNGQRTIDQLVAKGFRKFSIKPRKKK